MLSSIQLPAAIFLLTLAIVFPLSLWFLFFFAVLLCVICAQKLSVLEWNQNSVKFLLVTWAHLPMRNINYVRFSLSPVQLVYLPFSVFGIDPDFTREGGSIPVTLTLQEATGKNVMLLPLGACDDGAHSQNEKMDRKNYIEGVSITGNYGNTLWGLSVNRVLVGFCLLLVFVAVAIIRFSCLGRDWPRK